MAARSTVESQLGDIFKDFNYFGTLSYILLGCNLVEYGIEYVYTIRSSNIY